MFGGTCLRVILHDTLPGLLDRVLEDDDEVSLSEERLALKLLLALQEEVKVLLFQFTPQIEPLQAIVLEVLKRRDSLATREQSEDRRGVQRLFADLLRDQAHYVIDALLRLGPGLLGS